MEDDFLIVVILAELYFIQADIQFQVLSDHDVWLRFFIFYLDGIYVGRLIATGTVLLQVCRILFLLLFRPFNLFVFLMFLVVIRIEFGGLKGGGELPWVQMQLVGGFPWVDGGYGVERVDDVLHAFGLLQLDVGLLPENLFEEQFGVVDHGYLVVFYLLDQADLLVLLLQADLFVLETVVDLADLIVPPSQQLPLYAFQFLHQSAHLVLLMNHCFLLRFWLYLFGQVPQERCLFLFGEGLNVLLEVDVFAEVALRLGPALLQSGITHLHLLLELLVVPALGLRGGQVEAVPYQHED